jgi:transcriptional regulator with XRE-family HTH domain
MSASERWEEEGYGEIVAVEPGLGSILVHFANGDQVPVELAALGADLSTEFEVDDEGSLIARGAQSAREIDWMLIRRLDDPEFAEVLRERDAEESRRIGRRLRALRENNGLSQKDAAKLAEIAPSRLAKIERGETDLRISTVRSVLRAIGGSFADISGPEAPEVSVKDLAAKLEAPLEVLRQIAAKVGPQKLSPALARGFRWKSETVLRGVPDESPLGVRVAFKKQAGSKKSGSTPIERLARTLSELSAESFVGAVRDLPADPAAIRTEVIEEAGEVSLETLTRWAWAMGVVVVPMSGPGFQAAAWHVGERPVVVLKLSYDLQVYWLFALAHEIGHIALGHLKDSAVIDLDELGKVEDDGQETEANDFARDLLAPGSERLFAEIRRRSAGDLDFQRHKFKGKVEDVAEEEGLDPALLGILAAYTLTDVARQRDRWGSAINIAKLRGPARPLVREAFESRIELEELPELDAALVRAVVLE